MKSKIINSIVILCLLSGVFLIPGVFDKAWYHYYRIKLGSDFAFKNGCYSVPENWVILEDSNLAENEVDLWKMQNKKHSYATVRYEESSVIRGLLDKKIHREVIDKSPDYIMYDLEKALNGNPVHHYAVVLKKDLLVVGENAEEVEYIVKNALPVECSK